MKRCILLLLATVVLQAQAYCVYNFLADGSSFRVIQLDDKINMFRRFNKVLHSYKGECCDPSEATCVSEQKEGVPVYFEVQFWWENNPDNRRMVGCQSDGMLSIIGTENNHWAECQDSSVTRKVPLNPF
ncbi:hypothetical protein BDB01DRAFT_838426 [Pilobolus umbonatus]|nr:hypothetical protein BDB01DRAFT_838426 [Pilobolus umbonatus]